ncbi:MAG: ribose-phosphate diphosphokinase [Pseudomonadota bacterium]
MTGICFSFPDNKPFGRKLAAALGAEHALIDTHVFPDGETRVRLDGDCARREVIIVGGGRGANDKALPLRFAADAARSLGARRVGLVSPYLAYMRQDKQFHAGEAVSALSYARFLSETFDWLVTVDPHLHRLASLEATFSIPARCVSSMPAMAEWIAANVPRPVLVGPDDESAQWARELARLLSAPWLTLAKTRGGDHQVAVTLPDPAPLADRSPVIVDDIASTGRTIVETLKALQRVQASPATCIVVHAVLAPEAESAIRAAGAVRLVSTNTVAHASNGIDVAPLVAASVREILTP